MHDDRTDGSWSREPSTQLAGQRHRAVHDVHQRVAKYVATSTQLDREWANTTVVDGELIEFVRDLRNQPGADIGVHASISVAQALLAAGTACRGRRRRAQAGDRTNDRGQRAEAPRRLAGDSARVDPKHDLTDGLSARRLSRFSLVRVGVRRPCAALVVSGLCQGATTAWLRLVGNEFCLD
jgi:hypothetical protein